VKLLQKNSLFVRFLHALDPFPEKDGEKVRGKERLLCLSIHIPSPKAKQWWSLARPRPFFPATTPPRSGLFIPLLAPMPSSSQARQHNSFSNKASPASSFACDPFNREHVLLQRQLRVRLRLPVRQRLRRVKKQINF
jgi:hypothetical protein